MRRIPRKIWRTFFSKNGEYIEKDIDRFAELMIKDSLEADVIGTHVGLFEDYVVNHCAVNASVVPFDDLRVMVCKKSWGKGLEGKRVLVIHPFSDTIEKQYKRRREIWGENADEFLPEFELTTYKAVQTIAGNNTAKYDDWFHALDIMKSDIKDIPFDIAVIGCGAYGFPLAAECKRMGKRAIHLGGQTQMMFGIMGKRWEAYPYYKQFINEYWVRPSEEETPRNKDLVEGGCYW